MKIFLGVLLIIFGFGNVGHSQTPSKSQSQRVESEGTCATVATAPFGMAFIIDSKITVRDGTGSILTQYPGCKVLLARPTILLAGVGLVDANGRGGKWNSLSAASTALAELPPNPTKAQLKEWNYNWAKSLVKHFQDGQDAPRDLGVVSEMLLVTKIENEFYVNRTTVKWNGTIFSSSTQGQLLDQDRPQVAYSGLCRDFIAHDDGKGHVRANEFVRLLTQTEKRRLDFWGIAKNHSKTASELARAVYGLESVMVDIDSRLEPDHPKIGPPYAAAQWSKGESGWSTLFNAECGQPPRTPE